MDMGNSILSEVDILTQVVEPGRGDLSPESARALLSLRFNQDALERIDEFAEKNRQGVISDAERVAFEKYLRVGNFLNLIHAKAHVSLTRNKAD